ncbi:unnamed protein product [Phytophthora lilii]|uniref:Unnamed protein product n=1 Tax=Phytophthora lilii TaxID=2077276 RepID=A0A9W6X8M1_9STRA|nr:unnamed protein product [Phytophthora lilii]
MAGANECQGTAAVPWAATYLSKYVENYTGKIRTLSQLFKTEAVWTWTAECQQTFEAVKHGLTEAPILAVADQD